MTQRISWSVNAAVESGPTLEFSKSVQVEAFDVAVKRIAGGGGSETLNVQPSDAAGDMQFFMIKSDRPGSDVKFSVLDGGVSDVALDNLVILAGANISKLLQGASKKVKVVNDLAEDVFVEVVVGRKL